LTSLKGYCSIAASGFAVLATLTSLMVVFPARAQTPGLVAAYAFNEGSGTTVADISGNNNNGTITAATWTTAGKFGNALAFNGTSARVTVPNAASLQLTTGMTLEAWVFPTATLTGWQAIVDKTVDGYYLMASTDQNRPAAGGTWVGGNQNTYGPSVLAVNAWTHLAATFDGATVRLFVNGVQVASQAQTTALASTTGTLQIGGDSYPNEFFAGRIDEVRIYNRALSAAEIQTDMNTAVGGTPPPPDTVAPSAPAGLSATAASASQINLAWSASTDNIGVTGYRVERCQGAGCTTFAQIAAPAGTTFSDTGLAASTSYSYQVRAVDAAGNLSGYSNVSSANTPAAPPDTTAPTAPAALTATAVSTTQINLAWTASTDNVGVTGYQVDRCQGVGCTTFAQIGTSSVTSFSDTGLAAGTTYRYRVRATDAAGNVSANSSIVTATTQAAPDTTPPTAPAGLTATATSSSQINLAWSASTDNVGVTGYRVERCQGAGCTTFAQVATPTGTSFSDTGLAAGMSYSYQVRAADAAGNLGAYSNVASATTQTPDTSAPTAPTGLSATAAGSVQVTLLLSTAQTKQRNDAA